jgi:hypothetical protein
VIIVVTSGNQSGIGQGDNIIPMREGEQRAAGA